VPSQADFWSAVSSGKTGLAVLNGVTTGNSTAVALDSGASIRTATMVVRGSAGISAGAVQLQGTLDGTNWYNVGSPVTAVASANVGFTAPLHATQIRAVVSTTIVGGTVTVDLAADAQS
jgi:hypothetical protein